ncbi:helix-turn-helix domain-containing protein [Phycicoccus sp. M110.8]|uniref:helix-turn-helix domain-containing protein n=1 Tax=Phycicoccus sp. M110.8 TaxID=3075433 RepID=UPI0028FD8425|nr:helix-turn-helix domain-containing protein [Phycicoccus sp. M110.8]MDU0315013.1 helix-turn-helix domain-containing protein [Phycicoccus sp. M110.8]
MTADHEVALPRRVGVAPASPWASSGAAATSAPPSKRLLASWRRSEEYGVSLESVDPVWAGSVVSDSLFFECGHEVLTSLHRTLADEPLSLMLTDADGLVLNRFSGDTSLLRALDRVHLAPGFAFSEREAGTNGLGLALADRAPSLVRAEEHYSASLCTYTCAAVPVIDPVGGRLEGCVNITTWSRSSAGLLLALAESAASTTAALMLARSSGRTARSQARGAVFRVQRARLEPAAGTSRSMSATWTDALETATSAVREGRTVAAVGEPGSGRATLLGQALRRAHPRIRVLTADVPAAEDVEAWLSLWVPELAKPDTAVVVENVDALPAWAAYELRQRATAAVGDRPPTADGGLVWAVTARDLDTVPAPLAPLVGSVVEVAPLRERPEDVLALARWVAHQARMREVDFTPAAERALQAHDWPGNADELVRVVHDAASRSETVDVRHLPPAFSTHRAHRLSRMETLERDEIVRALARDGVSVGEAAVELGMSRATLYRKLRYYGVSR